MKTKFAFNLILVMIFMSMISLAQTPQTFKYQTVVRNAAGEIISNQNVSFRFSIRNASSGGPVVYRETHSVLTNQFGLAVLNIGAGTPVSGVFSAIDWGIGSKFLQVELDPAGGSAYVAMGTSQLLSVPYALYSENTANVDDADADPVNELQNLSIDGNELSISDGNTVTLPSSGTGNRISDNDGNTWIDTELNSNNDSIVFTTMGMNRMTIRPNGYINVNGQMVATGFQGDGSGLTGVPGDNLGDHTASGELDMNNHRIVNIVSPLNANDAATKLYVDTNVGDDLGDHTATQNIRLNGNRISNDGENEGIAIDDAGNVGINTTSPDQRLTVDGNIRSNANVMAEFGGADDPSYRFGIGTENTGLASPYANSLSIITNGTERLVVRQSGNIGIGTSEPQAPLHINGSLRIEDGYQGPGKVLTSDANGNAMWEDPASVDDGDWTVSGDNMYSQVNGNVGIGTSNPNQQLEITGNFRIPASTAAAGNIYKGNNVFIHNKGTDNIYAGENSGNLTATANNNAGVGAFSLFNVTTGGSQTAVGSSALRNTTTGINNTAIGDRALFSNTTGSDNTANGNCALYSNKANSRSTAIGHNAMFYADESTTGHETFNTAVGYEALRGSSTASANTGQFNTAIGDRALYSNTTGYQNTANGAEALFSNTTGSANIANGLWALYSNTTGYENTAIGAVALYSNTTGIRNTAIGMWVLYENTTGGENTAIGWDALRSNKANSRSTAIGHNAMHYADNRTTGHETFNTAVGYEALRGSSTASANTGQFNTAIGDRALYSNTTGYQNTANGAEALFSNTTGSANIANGLWALYSNTTGYENTAIGTAALYSNTTGNLNTSLGILAGNNNTTGSQNTFVGCHTNASANSLTNATAIGYGANVNSSNKIVIGNSSVTSIGGYAGWTNLSDARFKMNVAQNVPGLSFILKLNPVTYTLNIEKLNRFLQIPDSISKVNDFMINSITEKSAQVQTGFIAQEVESIANELGFDFSGIDKPKNENDHYGLRYAEFVVPLVKAVQEQQQMIDDLRNENKILKNEIDTIKQIIFNK